MDTLQWRQAWMDAMIRGGMSVQNAEEIYAVCYGNQDVDVASDPTDAASTFLSGRCETGARGAPVLFSTTADVRR